MLPYEKEVQKATKLYLLIINIGFALILLYAFITAATFFAIGQMHMNHVNPITLTATPIYAFITAATFFAIGQMHMDHVNPITLTGTPKLLQSPPL